MARKSVQLKCSGQTFKLSRKSGEDITLPRTFQFTDAEVELTAAGSETKRPKMRIIANTGDAMRVDGIPFPVVIDLQGAKFAKQKTPIVADHDIKRRIGHTTKTVIVQAGQTVTVDGEIHVGPVILANAVVSASTMDAEQFVADAKNDFPFEASVGAVFSPRESDFVDKGETVSVNGRTLQGPLIVARKTTINEISTTAVGADRNTDIKLAASARKGSNMDPEFVAFCASLAIKAEELSDDQKVKLEAHWKATKTSAPVPPVESPSDPVADLRTSIANEQTRLSGIQRVCASFRQEAAFVGDDGAELTFKASVGGQAEQDWTLSSFLDHSIRNENIGVQDAELTLMRASRARPSAPAIHSVPAWAELEDQAISCALVQQSGVVPANKTNSVSGEDYGYEVWYPDQVLEASQHKGLRSISLHQIIDMMIIRATGLPYTGNRKSLEFINAGRQAYMKLQASGTGQTNMGADNIFDDAANKMLWAGYEAVETTYQEWARIESLTDFKTHNFYRFTNTGGYKVIHVGGQIKHGDFEDEKYTLAADTYGKIVGIDRHHLINDDMGAFNSIMNGLGQEGARTQEELVYEHLLSNIGTIYTSGNANLITGATSDLGIVGLTLASQKFDDQVKDDAPIGVRPDRILVGTQDKVEAFQLFRDTEVRGHGTTKKESTKNPHSGLFRPIVSGYLNNTNIKQRVNNAGTAISNQDTDQWFMFSDPNTAQGGTILVGFLNGNRRPVLERSEMSFNVLGMQWRAYHDIGTGTGDPKLSVRSSGTS